MADAKSQGFALPSTVKLVSYHWCDIYTGPREDLIALGLVAPGCFPGEPGNGKTTVTFFRGERVRKGCHVRNRDEHYLQVERVGKRFKVTVGVPLDKQAERRKLQEQQREAEKRLQAREQVRKMTPEAFRSLMADQVKRAAVIVGSNSETDGLAETNLPYVLPEATWRQVLVKLHEAVELIESSTVVDRVEPALVNARKDAAFQQFLASQCVGGE